MKNWNNINHLAPSTPAPKWRPLWRAWGMPLARELSPRRENTASWQLARVPGCFPARHMCVRCNKSNESEPWCMQGLKVQGYQKFKRKLSSWQDCFMYDVKTRRVEIDKREYFYDFRDKEGIKHFNCCHLRAHWVIHFWVISPFA